MDIVDLAEQIEQMERDNALSACRAALSGRESASHCHDCGDEIPTARQRAVRGVQTCIYCQTRREHGRRQ